MWIGPTCHAIAHLVSTVSVNNGRIITYFGEASPAGSWAPSTDAIQMPSGKTRIHETEGEEQQDFTQEIRSRCLSTRGLVILQAAARTRRRDPRPIRRTTAPLFR
jgi:hypothetical protein